MNRQNPWVLLCLDVLLKVINLVNKTSELWGARKITIFLTYRTFKLVG